MIQKKTTRHRAVHSAAINIEAKPPRPGTTQPSPVAVSHCADAGCIASVAKTSAEGKAAVQTRQRRATRSTPPCPPAPPPAWVKGIGRTGARAAKRKPRARQNDRYARTRAAASAAALPRPSPRRHRRPAWGVGRGRGGGVSGRLQQRLQAAQRREGEMAIINVVIAVWRQKFKSALNPATPTRRSEYMWRETPRA